MPNLEQNESKTRQQYAKMKFDHQIQKAYRKGKLTEVVYAEHQNDERLVLIDPALVNYMYDANPASEFDTDHAQLLIRFNPRQQKNSETVGRVYELRYKQNDTIWNDIVQKSTPSEVYRLIVDSDPTPNKEYVQWILSMYTRVLKDREPKTNLDSVENRLGGFAYLFFENLYKVANALETFHKIKSTKILGADQKDIYTYHTIEHFVEVVFSATPDAPPELNTNVLNTKEWEALNANIAIVVHQDPQWVIVHTFTKEANNAFGEQTTWCTAGTRYGSMFDNYNKQGKLFVLVKNEIGASSHIKSNPENRLQFHFESDQYMNALDRPINILEFFQKNRGAKDYFRTYIVDTLLKKSSKIEDMIKTLNKFAMVKELIPILKEMKVKKLDLSGIMAKTDSFELADLGDIITLEELTMRDCDLVEVPLPIRGLTNLKILRLSGNRITKVPRWINELTKLEVFNVMKNQIVEPFDVSGLINLGELHFAFNKHLKELPTGIKNLKNLTSLDCSICDIREINDDILECVSLNQFNAIRNRNLSKIPTQLANLPNILFIGLDETNIQPAKYQELNSIKVNKQTALV